jgi:hypothetical protein
MAPGDICASLASGAGLAKPSAEDGRAVDALADAARTAVPADAAG